MRNKIIVFVVILTLVSLLFGCAVQEDNVPESDMPSGGEDVEGDTVPPTNEGDDNIAPEDIPGNDDTDSNVGDDETPSDPPSGGETPHDPPESGGDNIEPVPPVIKPTVTYDRLLLVTSKELNVRERPSGNSRAIARLRAGNAVALIEKVNSKWYKTYYIGKEAYISSSYVREIAIPRTNDNNLERVILEGKKLLGYPYVWGSQRYHWGNGILNKDFVMGKFDCSALMQYIFYKGARINLDVTTRKQVVQGTLVEDEVRRGDVLFFTNTARKDRYGIERVGHVALYLGGNYILHTAVDYAVIEEVSRERWSNYLVAKRFF